MSNFGLTSYNFIVISTHKLFLLVKFAKNWIKQHIIKQDTVLMKVLDYHCKAMFVNVSR